MLINEITDDSVEVVGGLVDSMNNYDFSIIESRTSNVTTECDLINVLDATVVVSDRGTLNTVSTQMTSNEWSLKHSKETQQVGVGDRSENFRVLETLASGSVELEPGHNAPTRGVVGRAGRVPEPGGVAPPAKWVKGYNPWTNF